jgi:hypothetical protein
MHHLYTKPDIKDRPWLPYIRNWSSKIGGFFDCRNPSPPLTDEQMKALIVDITDAIKFGIENARSGESLIT